MLIENPPKLYRALYPESLWCIPDTSRKVVYLTFDDGPIPDITPWVLDLLDKYNIKATFFCVGDNVRKYPSIFQELKDRGHQVGNHTFNHLQGIKTSNEVYIENVDKADTFIQSKLFRPPHGHIKRSQYKCLKEKYKIVMWDVVTRDYSKHMTANGVFNVVKKHARNGSIIVFHDSLKSESRMKLALPLSIEWLLEQGYEFKPLNEQ